MRVIVFFRGRGGGVGRVMPRIARELESMGYEVFVLTGSRDADSPNLLERSIPSGRILELGTTRLSRMVGPLRNLIKQVRPDGVICGAHLPSFVGAIATRMLRHRPILVTSIRTDVAAIFRPFGRTTTWALKLALAWTFMKSNAVVCVSEGVKKQLMSRFSKSFKHRTNPKVIYPATLDEEPAILRRLWIQSENPDNRMRKISLLWVGRLSEQKDPCAAIDCIRELRKTRSDVHLTIVGNGPLMQICERQIEQYGMTGIVRLVGQVNNPYPYYARSQIFLQTSRWGGLDNTLVEAVTFGLRIVSTDYPSGPREVLLGERFGRLVPVGDSVAMASACMSACSEGVVSAKELDDRDVHLSRFTSRFVAAQYAALVAAGKRTS